MMKLLVLATLSAADDLATTLLNVITTGGDSQTRTSLCLNTIKTIEEHTGVKIPIEDKICEIISNTNLAALQKMYQEPRQGWCSIVESSGVGNETTEKAKIHIAKILKYVIKLEQVERIIKENSIPVQMIMPHDSNDDEEDAEKNVKSIESWVTMLAGEDKLKQANDYIEFFLAKMKEFLNCQDDRRELHL